MRGSQDRICRRLVYIWLAAMLAACLSSCAQPEPNPRSALPTARQPILPGASGNGTTPPVTSFPSAQGFPWSISYRQNDTDQGAALARSAIARYDIAVLSDIPSVGEDIRQLTETAPDQLRILSVSPDTRPKGDPKIFAGHWLLGSGTRLASDLAAIDGITLVGVADPTVFSTSSDWPDDVLIYALGDNGQPDWSRWEEAVVARVDVKNKMLTLKRAQYGSRPREFAAGKAVIAHHMTGRHDSSSWVVNVSRTSPLATSGAGGAEGLAKIVAEEFSHISPRPSGIQLEATDWVVYQGADQDNSLTADRGRVNVEGIGAVNAWGLGSADFVKHLRTQLGADVGIFVGHSSSIGSRATPEANGIAYEGFDKDARVGFSSAYQRLKALSDASGAIPKASYLLVTTPTAAFSRASARPESNAPYRLGLGVALLNGMPFGYASAEPGDRASLGWTKDYYLDEYDAGAMARPNYLGQPLGPAVRLSGSLKRDDLLGGAAKGVDGWKAAGSGVTINDAAESPKPSEQSVGIESVGGQPVETTVGFEAQPQSAYTVVFSARAQNRYGDIDAAYAGLPSAVEVSLANTKVTPQTIVVGPEWAEQNITFYTGKSMGNGKAVVAIEPQDPGTVWVHGLEVREGTADILYRHFDGGMVMVNGSPNSVTIEMDMVAPGMKLRAIEGEQDPVVNHGKPVGTNVTIPAFDALILVK